LTQSQHTPKEPASALTPGQHKSEPQGIKLNQINQELFNINAKSYIEEKYPFAVMAQKKKLKESMMLQKFVKKKPPQKPK